MFYLLYPLCLLRKYEKIETEMIIEQYILINNSQKNLQISKYSRNASISQQYLFVILN